MGTDSNKIPRQIVINNKKRKMNKLVAFGFCLLLIAMFASANPVEQAARGGEVSRAEGFAQMIESFVGCRLPFMPCSDNEDCCYPKCLHGVYPFDGHASCALPHPQ